MLLGIRPDILLVKWEANQSAEWLDILSPVTDREGRPPKVFVGGPVRAWESVATVLVEKDTPSIGVMSCRLEVRPLPKTEPPARIIEEERKIDAAGGLDGLVSMCGPCVATYVDITFVSAQHWTSARVPACASTDDPVCRLARSATVEEVGYRLDGGAGGLQEISLICVHDGGEYRLVLRLMASLKVPSDGPGGPVTDARSLVLATLFEPNQVQDDTVD